ncbi:hypothetical protein [uncultured Kordia sp.]|uniref:hypothetical protein n=1 Tax=uncultured Kordia sp. TaxID=507699 RepID=UPI0026331168|nr:hypothetical protein [uncultured Kordia sp.]
MRKRYKASSLLHAVFACLLIALVCFGMLLLVSYNTLFQQQTLEKTQLQLTNNAAIEWQLSKVNLDQTETTQQSIFDDHIKTTIQTINWGFYKVIHAKTYYNQDTIHKSVLVGSMKTDNTALFVTDYDKIQSVAGKVKIIGDIAIPKARWNEKNMQGEKTEIHINGVTSPSKNKLPAINKKQQQLPKVFDYEVTLENLEENSVYVHSFDKETALLKVHNSHSLRGKKLKGNIIIEKSGTFLINKHMELEDVIIKADDVKIEAGFVGNIQVIAKNTVFIEDDVQLLYPSSIFIDKPNKLGTITIGENSVVMGSIILSGIPRKKASKSFIKIKKNAIIVGDLYCEGNLEITGKVYGSVYTNYLTTTIEKNTYKNMLMNVEINRSKLPKQFAGIPLMKTGTKKSTYEVIKEL